MKYEIYKILFDSNPDGSITYTQEDIKIINEEREKERLELINLIYKDYSILLNEIRKRIVGVAKFPHNDEATGVDLFFQSANILHGKGYVDCHGKSQCENEEVEPPTCRLSVSLWGEKLNAIHLFEKGEQIGNWICSEANTHSFVFVMPVSEDVSRQASQIRAGLL